MAGGPLFIWGVPRVVHPGLTCSLFACLQDKSFCQGWLIVLACLCFCLGRGWENRAGVDAGSLSAPSPGRVVVLEKVCVLQIAEQGSKPFVYKV